MMAMMMGSVTAMMTGSIGSSMMAMVSGSIVIVVPTMLAMMTGSVSASIPAVMSWSVRVRIRMGMIPVSSLTVFGGPLTRRKGRRRSSGPREWRWWRPIKARRSKRRRRRSKRRRWSSMARLRSLSVVIMVTESLLVTIWSQGLLVFGMPKEPPEEASAFMMMMVVMAMMVVGIRGGRQDTESGSSKFKIHNDIGLG